MILFVLLMVGFAQLSFGSDRNKKPNADIVYVGRAKIISEGGTGGVTYVRCKGRRGICVAISEPNPGVNRVSIYNEDGITIKKTFNGSVVSQTSGTEDGEPTVDLAIRVN